MCSTKEKPIPVLHSYWVASGFPGPGAGGAGAGGFDQWVMSHDGESGLSKIPWARLPIVVAAIATLVVALVGRLCLGCRSMAGSRSGTTRIIGGRASNAGTV